MDYKSLIMNGRSVRHFKETPVDTKALLELENKMREEGYKRFQLLAEETNPKAIEFYDREKYSKQKINFFCKYLKK